MPIFKINNKTILFLHIPKTAGTSIEQLLSDYGEMALYQIAIPGGMKTTPQHLTKHDIDLLFANLISYDLSFTVVRNPLERLKSEYFFRTKTLLNTYKTRPDFSIWAINQLNLFKKNKFHLDSHLRPMNHFIDDSVKVFKYESELPALHAWLQKKLEVKELNKFPITNTSTKTEVVISNECMEIILDIYKTDFSQFSYSVDI